MSEKELLDEESIPAGLRTIFTRIQRRDTIDALKEFGVALTDSEGKFVGAYKAIQMLSEGLSSIDPRDLKFSEIVEQLGGFRQIGKVIALIHAFLDEESIDDSIVSVNQYYSKLSRPSWDEYFLSLAFNISLRSEDPDIKHGSVIVNQYHQIIGTGYNGPIKGSINALIPLHIREEKRKWMIHAEENSILNSTQNPSERGDGCKIYITGQPCNHCLQRIINFGIKKIIIADRIGSITENDEMNIMRDKLLEMSGAKIEKFSTNNMWLKRFCQGVI